MAAEITSCNTVLTSETTLYQYFFHSIISSIFKKYLLSTVFAHFWNIGFLKSSLMKLFFKLLVSINDRKYSCHINGDEVTHNFECNREEADTRMVLHAALSSEDIVVVAADADILIMIIYAFMFKRRFGF